MKLYIKPVQSKRYRYFLQKLDSSFFFAGLIFAMSSAAQAQLVEQTQQSVAVSHNMPLSDEVYETPREPEERIEVPAPRIPIGQEALKTIKAQTNMPAVSPTVVPLAVIPTPKDSQVPTRQASVGCPVNSSQGWAPSDIHGAVGTTNLVVVTNSEIGVYNKSTCARVSYESLGNFFSAAGTSGQSLFDPRVLYDLSSGRFFVTVESMNGDNNDQNQYFAISKDSSGTSWWIYHIALSKGSNRFCKSAVGSFWDYPSAGYDKSNWYIAANDFGTSVTGAIISIDKANSMSGYAVGYTCFNSLESNIQPPLVMDSDSSAYFLSPGSGSGSSITRYKLTPTGSNGAGALIKTSSISISSWTAAPDAKQPNGQKLDTLDGRFQSASIQRGNYLWNVHTVALGSVSILRFYKLSTTGTTPLTNFNIYTGGTDQYLFNPSTAISPSGQAFIAASRTTPTNNASLIMIQGPNSLFSGWHYSTIATSPSQFLTDGHGHNCNDTIRGSCRWGDYSSTQLDPSNLEKAWGFNQLTNDTPYGTSQFSWLTHAGYVTGPSFSSFGFLPAIYYLLH